MESLVRLLPFVLRQRRAIIASVVLSIGAALFAVAQLSLIYPTMKLLLEGKTFEQHLHEELQSAQAAVERHTHRLSEFSSEIRDAQGNPETSVITD